MTIRIRVLGCGEGVWSRLPRFKTEVAPRKRSRSSNKSSFKITYLLIGFVGIALVLTLAITCFPFLGLLLTTAVPLAAALLQFNTIGPFITIAITILVSHLIAANFLIPKLVGFRLLVGPVAVTIGILF